MSIMTDDITPRAQRPGGPWRAITRITAVLLLAAATTVTSAVAPSAATNGAHFTSLERSLADLDDDGGEPGDDDVHRDDLVVSFSEVGVGQETVNVEVSSSRTVTARCVAAVGEFDVAYRVTHGVSEDEPWVEGEFLVDGEGTVYWRDTETLEDASLVVTREENGKISGVAELLVDLYEVCPDFHPDYDETAIGTVYALRDYGVVYEAVTVTDDANGGATLTLAEPVSYSADCIVTNSEAYAADEGFSASMLLKGVVCLGADEVS